MEDTTDFSQWSTKANIREPVISLKKERGVEGLCWEEENNKNQERSSEKHKGVEKKRLEWS